MNQRLYWQMHRLAFLFEKKADESLNSQLDIGFAQYKVLEAINLRTLAKQNEVAQMLDQTEASISRQVKILQKKGLINITDVMGNRRARELSLTTVGEELVSNAEEILDITQNELFGLFTPEEQKQLQILFERMLLNVRQD